MLTLSAGTEPKVNPTLHNTVRIELFDFLAVPLSPFASILFAGVSRKRLRSIPMFLDSARLACSLHAPSISMRVLTVARISRADVSRARDGRFVPGSVLSP